MRSEAPEGWTKFMVYVGIAARFGINAWLGTVPLDPRCRNPHCQFHAFGTSSTGDTCGRGMAGCGEYGVKFARGPVYATFDNARANDYGKEAFDDDNEESMGWVTLTAVVLIPTDNIYVTDRDSLLNHGCANRNFWWKPPLNFKMIRVTDSIGNYVNDLCSCDIALMDLSFFHITQCIPSHAKRISPENGLTMLLYSHNGIMVIDNDKALKVGVFGTKEIAARALALSDKPWDVEDRSVAAVFYVRVCVISVLSVCWPMLCCVLVCDGI